MNLVLQFCSERLLFDLYDACKYVYAYLVVFVFYKLTGLLSINTKNKNKVNK